MLPSSSRPIAPVHLALAQLLQHAHCSNSLPAYPLRGLQERHRRGHQNPPICPAQPEGLRLRQWLYLLCLQALPVSRVAPWALP